MRSNHLVLSLAVASLLPLVASAPGQAAEWQQESIGRTAVLRLATAPFPHRSRPAYRDDRVLVFLPSGYVPGERVDVIVHYHGHLAEAVASARARRLREQLAASGKAALLLCPQGPLRARDSGGGKHEESDGLRRFLEDALAALAGEGVVPEGARVGRLILSGHSGAYRVIGRGLLAGGAAVDEVWLHDAVYGFGETFALWAAAPDRRLISTHTPHGGTRANNRELRRHLARHAVPIVTSQDEIQGARAAVLAVPESHDAVTGRFEAFCRTSCLDDLVTVPLPPDPGPGGPSRGITDALGRMAE